MQVCLTTMEVKDFSSPNDSEDCTNNHDDSETESNIELQNNGIVSRDSRTRRKSQPKEIVVTERKSIKRKSIADSPYEPDSKIPKYDSVQVKLKTKTIYLSEAEKESYQILDRNKLILLPEKVGDFEVGDLVWAKLTGFPWWPCMVAIDPTSGIYSKVAGEYDQQFCLDFVFIFGFF